MYSHRLAAVIAAIALAAPQGPRPITPAARLAAQVRFANKLGPAHSWSLASNSAVIFGTVAGGTTTAYIAVTDSTSKLTLLRDSGDSVFATTNYQFVAGSYYTVTATIGNGVRPQLDVERDRPPSDTTPALPARR